MAVRVDKKLDPTIVCLQEIHFKSEDSDRLRANGWRKIYHINTNQKKAGEAILISNNAEFRTRKINRDKRCIT